VPKVGVMEDRSAVGGGEAGRAKSCLRVLAPIRVLGKARGRGAFEKLGAVLSKCGVEDRGRRVGTCRKPLEKVNFVQTMIELVVLLCIGERLRACRCWGLGKAPGCKEHCCKHATGRCHGYRFLPHGNRRRKAEQWVAFVWGELQERCRQRVRDPLQKSMTNYAPTLMHIR
jgi:hypothetical protein